VGLVDEVPRPLVSQVLELDVPAAELTGEADGTWLGGPHEGIGIVPAAAIIAAEDVGDQGLQARPVGRPELHDGVGIVVDQIRDDLVLGIVGVVGGLVV
jgi:hypothetical protein